MGRTLEAEMRFARTTGVVLSTMLLLSACAECSNDSDCTHPNVCNRAYSSKRCTPPGEAGDPCTREKECNFDTWCAGEVCKMRLQENEACWNILECQAGLICFYLGNGEKECREPTGLNGHFCVSDFGCQPELVCVVKAEECSYPKLEGEECHYNDECEGELVCNWGYNPDVCAPLGLEGDICGYFNECEDGLYCNESTVPDKCTPAAGPGMHCTDWVPCEPDLQCISEPGFDTCYAPGGEGYPCYDDSDCGDGFWCEGAESGWFSSTEGECEVTGLEGYPCSSAGDVCAEGFVCVGSGDKECTKIKKVGYECKYNDECEGDLICNWGYDPPKCKSPGEEGDICGYYNECIENLYCNDTVDPNVCSPASEELEPCTDWLLCAEGLICASPPGEPDVCRNPGQPGDECLTWLPCEEGLICNALVDPPACWDTSGLGEPCGPEVACDEGLACSTALPEQVGECMELPEGVVPCSGQADECPWEEVCNLYLTPPQCAEPAALGEECGEFFPCVIGLDCDLAAEPPVCVGGG